jgi:cytochrome b subunit of formate dehydrogenase/nitrate/TMAO reductase-like tetraheme cytochrome c subunit
MTRRLALLLSILVPSVMTAAGDEECLTCHAERSLSMERKGKTVSLFVDGRAYTGSAHADLGCVSCHEGFRADALPHATRIRKVECLSCHDGDQFAHYAESVHGKPASGGARAAGCADCHGVHDVARITTLAGTERKELAGRMCGTCHGEVATRFAASDHGRALAAGVAGAPSCVDCHDEHDVLPASDDSSRTNRSREAAMCMSCHLDDPDVRARVGPSAGFIASYEQSVHARAVRDGNIGAATCSDCHGAHDMQKSSLATSHTAKGHIAETCGQCHGDVRALYDASTHGTAVARGVLASATCTDCHGEHGILSPSDPRSPVAPANVSAQVCSPCHGSLRLTEKYGLAANRFQSFEDSYHGLAGRAGSLEVANCASCHGVHDIKPSTDSTSRIHPANLAATCGSCHPGAGVNFTRGAVHVIPTSGEDRWLYLVSAGYIVLILVVVGGMFLHNLLDFVRKSRRKLMQRRGLLPHPPPRHRLYLRMSLGERFQHGTLALSFIILVITGFALRFPDAWWVAPVRNISPVMFDLRSLIHRTAGVVLVVVSLYHIYYVLVVPRGKQLLRDLLPQRSDLTDALAVLKYNLRISPEKPQFGRFSYIEKSEYWALVWGTIVMGATGVILWFDNTFLNLLTKTGWDIARTVHYYEAWLATLAIVVWHFYFVMFNPDIYPINLAFWKGTLTEEEMEDEHPLELARIHEEERAEREADPPAAPNG